MNPIAITIPKVGSAASFFVMNDSHAATVIRVKTINDVPYIWVQADFSMQAPKKNKNDQPEYTYSRNTEGHTMIFRLNKREKWDRVWENDKKDWVKSVVNSRLILGERKTKYFI